MAPPLVMIPSYDAGRLNEVKSLSSAVTLRLEFPQIPLVPFFGILLMHVVVSGANELWKLERLTFCCDV